MNFKNLFTPVKNMDSKQAKKFMADMPVGSYQLIDVRQPREYEKEHLPGSKLIPLADLPSKLNELDKEKPTIVY